MANEKKGLLSEFSRRAMQRLQDKKNPKYLTLHVPSEDMDVKIRNLTHNEMVEISEMEGDRGDRYCLYQAIVEPDLKKTAQEIMEEEKSLPADQRTLLEPLDIIDIFNMAEISQIALQVMELSGVTSSEKVTVVDNLKN